MNLERNGTLKKQKKHLFLQKNQLTMNNFRKKMVYLQCCSKQAADMKQPCLVRTENLDNSLYTRTKTEVVHPIVYYCIIPLWWDGYLHTRFGVDRHHPFIHRQPRTFSKRAERFASFYALTKMTNVNDRHLEWI